MTDKRCPPPSNFLPAGKLISAKLFYGTPPFVKPVRSKGRRAEGRRYERKAHRGLLDTCSFYAPGPWIRFVRSNSSIGWCQPDGLILDIPRGHINIVEIKLKHTPDAWWQTRKLYEPVLRFLFPKDLWTFSVTEVVRWYDPATPFPERYKMLSDVREPEIGKFHVHIWNG